MNSRPIQPIEIKWGNTVTNTITKLHVRIDNDNLSNTCTFGYSLLNNSNISISDGHIHMSEIEYANWDGNNDFPFTYVADKLNLTLI